MKAGDSFAGRYRLTQRLGGGGHGEVWAAHDETLNQMVALKVLHVYLSPDSNGAERFRREARVTAPLHGHPAIVEIKNAEFDRSPPYIAMELVRGQDLGKTVREHHGLLPIDKALDVISQLTYALQAAHAEGIVHRDIKPSNVMLRPDGSIKVCDFGIAKLADSGSFTSTDTGFGTPECTAPEQWRDASSVAPPADFYSVGCTLFYLLTGRFPFEGDQKQQYHEHLNKVPPLVSSFRPEVPREIDALVAGLLAKDPQARPTADNVRAVLRDTLAPPPSRQGSGSRSRRSLLTAVLVAAAMIAVIVAVVASKNDNGAPARPPVTSAVTSASARPSQRAPLSSDGIYPDSFTVEESTSFTRAEGPVHNTVCKWLSEGAMLAQLIESGCANNKGEPTDVEVVRATYTDSSDEPTIFVTVGIVRFSDDEAATRAGAVPAAADEWFLLMLDDLEDSVGRGAPSTKRSKASGQYLVYVTAAQKPVLAADQVAVPADATADAFLTYFLERLPS